MASRFILMLLLSWLTSVPCFSQLKGKANKLVGKWEYRQGSGFEVWSKVNDNELKGAGYRWNKLNDSIQVEDLNLKLVNGRLVYTLGTTLADSVPVQYNRMYIGDRRKLLFQNTTYDEPHAIRYRFGIFSPNRLKIIIYSGGRMKQKLFLRRIEE